jgi:hypothetical protein
MNKLKRKQETINKKSTGAKIKQKIAPTKGHHRRNVKSLVTKNEFEKIRMKLMDQKLFIEEENKKK